MVRETTTLGAIDTAFSSTDHPQGRASEAEARRAGARPIVLAVDAMSGEHGPQAVVEAVASLGETDGACRAILFGQPDVLAPYAARVAADGAKHIELRRADGVVPMDAGPRDAVRVGQGSSMKLALEAVSAGEADVAFSAGNTAALMTMAARELKLVASAAKPAIAALWPSRNPAGFNVVLDMGAGLDADAEALTGFGVMGAAYARLTLGVEAPRIGLLNVGAEKMKGHANLRAAAQSLEAATRASDGALGRFIGFVEGDQISSSDVDVVVTDGFTGNVALKSAEGTARLIAGYAREAFSGGLLRRAAAAIAYPALSALRRRMDPRRVNGGVFLGLNGAVVKSHSAADAIALGSALRLASTIGQRNLVGAVRSALAEATPDSQYHATEAVLDRAAGRVGKV